MGVIKIFVAAHKPVYVPKNRCLLPVQAGTALAGQKYTGMFYDSEGENISQKNRLYCELTVQYWAWKNQEADYYGFFHYRRYMDFAREYPVGKDGRLMDKRWTPYKEKNSMRRTLSELKLEEAQIHKVVEKYEVITVLSERMSVTAYQQFCQFHSSMDIDCVIAILKRRYPAYAHACDVYMNSKYIYFCNMYIMNREIFRDYMEWLFSILDEFEREKNISGHMRRRAAGYLAERLFGVYYTHLKMQGRVKCCELQYVVFRDMEKTSMREFSLWNTGLLLRMDMAVVNRLFPAGTLRRRMLRTFVRAGR